jgi:hypothetical protein
VQLGGTAKVTLWEDDGAGRALQVAADAIRSV